MLVLSRKRGEAVLVDDAISVKVVRIEGGRVVLGFDAPRSVPIDRAECSARKRSEEAASA
ncbi:MAG: carbon storage regulator [Planctomycetota bacterium]